MARPLEVLLVDSLVRVATITVALTLGVGIAALAIEFGAVDWIAALANPLTSAPSRPGLRTPLDSQTVGPIRARGRPPAISSRCASRDSLSRCTRSASSSRRSAPCAIRIGDNTLCLYKECP